MTYHEARELKDKYEPIVIGKPFISHNGKEIREGYTITHVFIAPAKDPMKTINVWTKASTLISNDEAILRSVNLQEDFEVYLFSYSSWGDGNLYHRLLSSYIEQQGL